MDALYTRTLTEVLTSTLPIAAVILLLQICVLNESTTEIFLFVACIIMVIVGFTIFLVGVEKGINPVGEAIGSEIPKRRSKFFMVAVVFAISFLVTVAEPDVSVFASQVTSLYDSLSNTTLIYAIAVGVGGFLILAACRIVFKLSLRLMLTIGYSIALFLMIMAPDSFVGIAFDSGGVTTGPMTVPILLSLGIGICSVGLYRNELDGFGMIGLASAGPIIAILIVGILSGDSSASTTVTTDYTPYIDDVFERIKKEFLATVYSVIIAIVPLTLFFTFFQRVFLRFSWNAVKRMLSGITMASVGVIIFLTAIYSAFIPVATQIGAELMDKPIILIPLGALLGFLVAIAEPAVSILSDRVERSSDGHVSKTTIKLVISAGVAVFVAIGMAKISFDINLMFIIIPGYVLALILMWMGDKDMVGITFDAGGVSTGPMSVAIIGTMYTGIAAARYTGETAIINGFGIIALIALAPIVFLGAFSVYIKLLKEKSQ